MCVYCGRSVFENCVLLRQNLFQNSAAKGFGKSSLALRLTKDRRRAIALRRSFPADTGSHKRENVMGKHLLPYAAETDVITDHKFKRGFMHSSGLHR